MVGIDVDELETAVMAASDGMASGSCYVCRATGEVLWDFGELGDDSVELPEDLDDDSKYAPVPTNDELGLGSPIVFRFVRQAIPGEYERVRGFFERRGAFRRFKDFLDERGLLERWHEYEDEATREALAEWAETEGFELVEKQAKAGIAGRGPQ